MKIPKMPLRLLAGLLIAIAALAGAAPAEAQWCPRTNLVEQSFPIAGPEETRWRICWQMQHQFGLVITGAWFRKTPAAPWVQVFFDARVSEIFVPYHGNENRFFDIKDFNWDWVRLEPSDCPAATGGTLLGPGPDVCKTLQNRGIAWKLDDRRRLGEQVLLWGAIAAANYNYIVQWIFRDDGMVVGRVAATGANYPYHPEVAHLHSPTWRLDIDLNGASGDSSHLFVHTENLPGPTATDSGVAINNESSYQPVA
jgi:Cu2+-containing amine oxidase